MASTYEYTGIVSTTTVDLLAAADLTQPQAIALALTEDGVKLPAAGADVVGIAIISNEETVKTGERVAVQVKDIGLWRAGAEFKAGDLLATDATGKAVKAATGNAVVAMALENAAANDLVKVKLILAGTAA